MKTEQFIFWTHPLAEVILNRTETPGNTTPPGINKSGKFLGIWAFSDDIVLIMSVSPLPLCNLFCLYQIYYLVSWRTQFKVLFSVYLKIPTYLMNRYRYIIWNDTSKTNSKRLLISIQGVSVQNDKFKIMIRVGLSYIRKHSWCLAYSQISTIWVSSKYFQKSYIDWPQQPPTEKVPNIREKLHFWWSIPQKWTSIGHFGAREDQTIRIR